MGLDGGDVTPVELAGKIEAFRAIMREALQRALTIEEHAALAELVEYLREFLGDAVEP